MSMSGSYARKSVSNCIIKLYAKLFQIVIETNLICDVIIINNKKRHNSFTIFTTRRVVHTDPYFLQNIFILSVWPLRGHLAAEISRNVNAPDWLRGSSRKHEPLRNLLITKFRP